MSADQLPDEARAVVIGGGVAGARPLGPQPVVGRCHQSKYWAQSV